MGEPVRRLRRHSGGRLAPALANMGSVNHICFPNQTRPASERQSTSGLTAEHGCGSSGPSERARRRHFSPPSLGVR